MACQSILVKQICLSILALAFLKPIYADNLSMVYHQAVQNDPTFKEAEATWLANRQAWPIALAQLLPQINGTAAYNYNYSHIDAGGFESFTNGNWRSASYALSLSQPIFNANLWFQLKGASAVVKSGTAAYAASIQDLMVRTVTAYINILQAVDQLRYTRANKQAIYEQFVVTEQKFKVGLLPINDLYDAQAKYDQIVATEIANLHNVEIQIENLHAITSKYYKELNGLSIQGVPLISPIPNDINSWSSTAKKQNYNIQAQYFNTIYAYDTYKAAFANHFPTVEVNGAYQEQTNFNQPGNIFTAIQPGTTRLIENKTVHIKNGVIGFTVNAPIFEGGGISAVARQRSYDYADASATLEAVYRQVINQTHQFFLGMISSISQVKADKQAIVSSFNALKATRIGYEVGTRTILDVFNDLTSLINTQRQYSADQYTYILNFINLKKQAGTLSYDDIQLVNSWLTQLIHFNTQGTLTETYEKTLSYSTNQVIDTRTQPSSVNVDEQVAKDIQEIQTPSDQSTKQEISKSQTKIDNDVAKILNASLSQQSVINNNDHINTPKVNSDNQSPTNSNSPIVNDPPAVKDTQTSFIPGIVNPLNNSLLLNAAMDLSLNNQPMVRPKKLMTFESIVRSKANLQVKLKQLKELWLQQLLIPGTVKTDEINKPLSMKKKTSFKQVKAHKIKLVKNSKKIFKSQKIAHKNLVKKDDVKLR